MSSRRMILRACVKRVGRQVRNDKLEGESVESVEDSQHNLVSFILYGFWIDHAVGSR